MLVITIDPADNEGIIRRMWISLGFSYLLKLVASERKTSHFAEKNRRVGLVLGSSESSSSTDFKSWFWFWNYSKERVKKKYWFDWWLICIFPFKKYTNFLIISYHFWMKFDLFKRWSIGYKWGQNNKIINHFTLHSHIHTHPYP